MPNYRQLYLHLFRAVTRAIDILVKAQQECEELYLAACETEEDAARNEKE